MERSRGTRNGVKVVLTSVFLLAALLSTGCGQNALMNPTTDQLSNGDLAANQAGNNLRPAGNNLRP